MSIIIREQYTDPEVRTIAFDIARAQQHQEGQILALLRDWGLPQTTGASTDTELFLP